MNKLVLFIIIVLGVWVFCKSSPVKEKFVEVFASAGYQKPVNEVTIDYDIDFSDAEFNLQSSGITHDDIRSCVIPTIELIKKETGLCTTVLETNKIEFYKSIDGRRLFKCRFMMMVKDVGFPFGFGISVEVLDGRVVMAKTQPITSGTEFSGTGLSGGLGENFLPASDLLPKPKSLLKFK